MSVVASLSAQRPTMIALTLFAIVCLSVELGSGQFVDCSANYACEGDVITIPSNSVFNVSCQGYHSCFGAKLIVESNSTLGENIQCDGHTECCKNMTILVFDSDLDWDNFKLDCSHDSGVDSCDDMNLTLVRSSLKISCDSGTCDALRATLYDSFLRIYGSATHTRVRLFGRSTFNCASDRSCFAATVIVESGSELLEDIDCGGDTENCKDMELEVYDSELAAGPYKIDCSHIEGNDSCDDMLITLMRSSLRIKCSEGDCDRITVRLYDSELVIESNSLPFADGNWQVYLYGSSVLTDETGIMGPYIDMYYMTTAKPTSTVTPFTSTTIATVVANTTRTIVHTTDDPTNNKGSKTPILVILVATFSVLALCCALGGILFIYYGGGLQTARNTLEPGAPGSAEMQPAVVGIGVAEGGHAAEGCEDNGEKERDAKDVAFGQVLGDFNLGIAMLEEDVVEDMSSVGETAGFRATASSFASRKEGEPETGRLQ